MMREINNQSDFLKCQMLGQFEDVNVLCKQDINYNYTDKLSIVNSSFEEKIEINIDRERESSDHTYEIYIENTVFKKTLYLIVNNCTLIKIAGNCIFKKGLVLKLRKVEELVLENIQHLLYLKFLNCDVNTVNLYQTTVPELIIGRGQFGTIYFEDNHRIESIQIENVESLNSITMSNLRETTKFDLVDSNVEFIEINESEIQKIKTNNSKLGYCELINNQVTEFEFIDSDFKNKFRLNNTPENTDLKLHDCKFFDTFDISDSNFNTIRIDKCYFHYLSLFEDLSVNNTIIYSTFFEKIASFNNFSTKREDKLNLETIRIIKSNLLKSDNYLEYLHYNALEKKELIRDENTKKYDKVLLKLNCISNDFGRNWLRGVGFTLLSGIIGFNLIILTNTIIHHFGGKTSFPILYGCFMGISDINSTIISFFQFLLPVGFYDDSVKENGILLLISIVTKIAIGYGIYQTITAFRKYGKNS